MKISKRFTRHRRGALRRVHGHRAGGHVRADRYGRHRRRHAGAQRLRDRRGILGGRSLKDNVTINLNIGFSALGTGILGSTGSARSLLSMNQTYNALNADRTSALDNQAVANLRPLGTSTSIPGAGAVTFTGNAINATNNGYVDTATRIDNDGGVNNSTTAVTKASAKALGLTTDVKRHRDQLRHCRRQHHVQQRLRIRLRSNQRDRRRFVRFHRCRNPRDRPRTRLRQRRGQLRCPYRPRGHGGNAGNVRRRQPARSVSGTARPATSIGPRRACRTSRSTAA